MTILEKLQTASVEDVAKFLDKQFDSSCPPESLETCPDNCIDCWVRWLECPVDMPAGKGGLNSI